MYNKRIVVLSYSYGWVLQDILGVLFCISLLKNLRLPSMKICTLLLVLLLVYDVFFVFITPLFSANHNSVMVDVATGKLTFYYCRKWTCKVDKNENNH